MSAPAVGISRIGLCGLAVMGQARPAAPREVTAPPLSRVASRSQNLALNVAEKGFPISVYNRSSSKTDDAVKRAAKEGALAARDPSPPPLTSCQGWTRTSRVTTR